LPLLAFEARTYCGVRAWPLQCRGFGPATGAPPGRAFVCRPAARSASERPAA